MRRTVEYSTALHQSPLNWAACLGFGVAAAIVGLLPWLLGGGTLPLQLLWAHSTLPDDMPFVLLPFSQYAIFLLLGLLGAGYVIAGVALRVYGARVTAARAWVTWAGVFAVQGIAVAQTTVVVANGQQDGAEAELYLAALLAVVVISAAIGTLGFWLIVRAPVPGAMIGLAIGAVCIGEWMSGFVSPLITLPSESASWISQNIFQWMPAVLIGATIAWGGLSSWARRSAALLALVILWVQIPLTTAINSATSRVALRYPSEMLDRLAGVLQMMVSLWDVTLLPVLVALVVAALRLTLRLLLSRRKRALSSSGQGGSA